MKLGTIDITKAYYGSTELTSSNAYLGEVAVIENEPPVIEYSGLTVISKGNSTVWLKKLSTYQTLEYSTDLETWTNMTTATTINLANKERVFFRGKLTGANNTSDNWTQFGMSGNTHITGNLDYLFNYTNLTAALKNYCGLRLFAGCAALTDISGLTLPHTTLVTDCYNRMFQGTKIVDASMLVLPSTSLYSSCYRDMFQNCTVLEKAPTLPATTLKMDCYNEMFINCSSLKYVTCLATNISALRCTNNWLSGVAATGTFYKNSSMTGWSTGTSGIPSGWTIVDAS